MSKTHSKTIHIGNQGEHIVSAMLSANCIVREVGQGKDTGIDLYCEILNPETLELSIHFFCQVKTAKGSSSLNGVDERHLEYWGKQPAPVFVFVVEYTDENRIREGHRIWVYDIPYILVKKDAKNSGKEQPLREVDEKFELCNETNNKDKMSLKDFLYGHIPWSHGLWQMRRFGLVFPNPEIKETRFQFFVGGFSPIYKEKICKAINHAEKILSCDERREKPLKPTP